MTGPHDRPTLDDVIEPEENADPRPHAARQGPAPGDEVLEHRTEQERQAVGSDDADPAGAEEHPATD